MYEVFEHTADLGLRIQSPTLNELFADAARALFSTIVANPETIPASGLDERQERVISLSGDRVDFLLFDWLSELLYLFDTEHLVLFEFEVHLENEQLAAVCRGIPSSHYGDRLEHEVKAITYHELRVVPIETGWLAEVIIDI